MRVTLVHAHAIAPWYCTRSVLGKSCVVPRLCVRTQDAPWIMPHSWGCPFGTTANHALCHACVHTRPPHGVRARSALGNSRVVSRVCVHARDAPWIMPHRIMGLPFSRALRKAHVTTHAPRKQASKKIKFRTMRRQVGRLLRGDTTPARRVTIACACAL